jgi:SAM-dependent methyltransferase
MPESSQNCPICANNTSFIGHIKGRIPPFKTFSLCHCPNCHFSFIPDYRADYETIYSEEYYQGRGADPLVNYEFDHREPELTLRQYEWNGLTRVFQSLVKGPQPSWLDYGCGLGSLVSYARRREFSAFGYEPYASSRNSASTLEESPSGQPLILSPQDLAGRSFDFITAIEVIEHVADPLAFLGQIRPLLKPGGVLFLTTGNAKPFRARLTNWSYASCPDVHVSFFEPETLALAFAKTNFRPVFAGYLPGFSEIIKYKILKNLKFKKRSFIFDLLPFSIISYLTNIRYQVTAMPIGIAD